MNLDLLGNWKGGAIQDAGDEAILKHGSKALDNIDIGLLESGFGATEDHVRNYIKKKQQESLNSSELRSRAISAGLTGADGSGGADFGDTTGSYLSKIVKQEEAVEKQDAAETLRIKREDNKTSQTNALEIIGAQNQNSNNQFNATLKATNARHAFDAGESSKRYAHEKSEGKLDRRQQMELSDSQNGLQMQMAIMQNDLSEKRMDYDRETRRMDKRSEAIAQLMSGLGSLSGAFSIRT